MTKDIKIYSIHYNKPEFIDWQYKSFKYHLKDNFELIIVNNAKDDNLRKEINKISNQNNIKVIETHSKAQLAGLHHVESYNYIWQNYAVHNKNCYNILMDGDCFLIKSFSVNDFMKDYILAGPKQQRNFKYHYLTPTIIISDTENLPEANAINWEGIGISLEDNVEIRLDTGGGLYLYYQKHPEIKEKTKEINSSWHIKNENNNLHCLPDELKNNYLDEYNVEFFGNEFLHYCRSSNWDYQTEQHHINKSNFVKNFIDQTINGTIAAKEHNFQIENKTYFGWGE